MQPNVGNGEVPISKWKLTIRIQFQNPIMSKDKDDEATQNLSPFMLILKFKENI